MTRDPREPLGAQERKPRPGVRRPRCDAQARKGTGTGICDTALDEHGNCLYAGNHIEVG